MKLRILSEKEFFAGLFFILIGAGWAYAASRYDLGSATDMGPGYFPMAVSVALIVMGACSIFRATRVVDLDRIGSISPVACLIVLLSIASFGLLLTRFGLIAASLALIVVCTCQRLLKRPIEVALLAASLIAFNAILFVYILQMPLNLF